MPNSELDGLLRVVKKEIGRRLCLLGLREQRATETSKAVPRKELLQVCGARDFSMALYDESVFLQPEHSEPYHKSFYLSAEGKKDADALAATDIGKRLLAVVREDNRATKVALLRKVLARNG